MITFLLILTFFFSLTSTNFRSDSQDVSYTHRACISLDRPLISSATASTAGVPPTGGNRSSNLNQRPSSNNSVPQLLAAATTPSGRVIRLPVLLYVLGTNNCIFF